MRKFLLTVLVLLIIALVCVYIYADLILELISAKAIDFLMKYVQIPNLEYTRPVFESVKFTSFSSITWYKLSIEVSMIRDDFRAEDFSLRKDYDRNLDRFVVKMDSFTLNLADILNRTIIVSFKGFSAWREEKRKTYHTDDIQAVPDGVKGGDMKLPIKMNEITSSGVIAQIKSLGQELKDFSRTGVSQIPIQFSAEETFTVKGKLYAMKVSVVKEADGYRLLMDEHGMQHLANTLTGIQATEGDIKFIARNPIAAPMMLRIRNNAETLAAALHKNDPLFPEDAFRHIYWSYVLTKQYGERFSEDATDAHEMVSDSEERKNAGEKSFEAASYQDFVCADLGRRYAVRGYDEKTLVQHTLHDPDVIRDNEVMIRFDPQDYKKRKSASPWLRAYGKHNLKVSTKVSFATADPVIKSGLSN